MGTKKEVKERRKIVKGLLLVGTKTEDIAKKFGISTRMIDKDIAAIREEFGNNIRVDSEKLFEETWKKLGEYREEQRMRIYRLWSIIADKTSEKRNILNALKLLQEEENLRIRRDQLAGTLPQDSPLIAIQQNFEGDQLPEILEAYIRKVENELKSKPKKRITKKGTDAGSPKKG